MPEPVSKEQQYYNALKRIAAYMPPDKLRRLSEKEYGLSYGEALEFAYENIIDEARLTLKGMRRPK